jgi:hypothetical protein
VSLEDLGRKTSQAGSAASESKSTFDQLKDVFNTVSPGAGKLLTAMGLLGAAFTAVKAIATEYWQELQRVQEAQNKVAESARAFAESAGKLAAQTGQTTGQAGIDLADLAATGGLKEDQATAFGQAFDRATKDRGGLSQNIGTAKALAGAVGAFNLETTDQNALLDVLEASGSLGSAEDAKAATAKIAAAAAAAGTTVGGFSTMVASKGGRALKSGVALDDVLQVAGQARKAETSDEAGGQNLATFETLAFDEQSGLAKDIKTLARQRGLDPATLTSAQRFALTRELLGQERDAGQSSKFTKKLGGIGVRGERAADAFGPGGVAAASDVSGAIANASAADVDRALAVRQTDIAFQQNRGQAQERLREAVTGEELAPLEQSRNIGKREFERKLASGEISAFESVKRLDEVFIDEETAAELERRANDLRKRGGNTSEVDEALKKVRGGGLQVGLSDDRLADVSRKLSAAERDVRVTNYNVGTMYHNAGPEPGLHAPADEGLEAARD